MKNKDLDLLLRKMKMGNEDAFVELYNATKKGLFAFIYTYLNNYQDSEDILLETFIKIRSNIQRYKDNTNPTAWMFQIAKNEALNYINKNKRVEYVDFQENVSIAGNYEMDVEGKQILEITIKVLSQDEARIVLLHAVEGYKHQEISKILNMPLGTVLWKYNKAIKTLQEALGEYR